MSGHNSSSGASQRWKNVPVKFARRNQSVAMSEFMAYIPDMSSHDAKRVRHRQRQARYEARLRDGIGLFPTPLRASEIDVLISLNYLPEGAEGDRVRVAEAIAAAIRSLRDS
jgi:hypothetical protein